VPTPPPVEPPHPVAPPEVIKAIEQPSFQLDFQEPPLPPAPANLETPKAPVTAPTSETNAPESEATTAQELLDRVKNKSSDKEDNLGKLRKKSSELTRQIEERDTELQTLRTKVEKYEKGEIPHPENETLKTRVADLEKYEQLHNLRMSREYQEKFVGPINELGEQAAELAIDYGIDPQVLSQALGMNKKERNLFLRKHFQDDVGALEARQALERIDELQDAARAAELEPGQKLQQLQEEFRANELQIETRRRSGIATGAEKGWQGALGELRATGNFPMLSLREGDEEHNAFVRPILEAGAQEYGKFTKFLAEAGLKEIPDAAAKILAKRWILSQAASVIAASGAQHFQRAEEIIKESERQAAYIRPPVGGGGARGNGGGGEKPKTMSPQDAAREALRRAGISSS
jgi:hypothetical protein